MDTPLEWRRGSCHCRAIQFEVLIPRTVDVYRCNCSICFMKQNHHFVVGADKIRRISGDDGVDGADSVRIYRFGTGVAKHNFCAHCGICPYYTPRSNPDGFGITIYCMHDFQPSTPEQKRLRVVWKDFDGQNWEQNILTSDIRDKTAAGGTA